MNDSRPAGGGPARAQATTTTTTAVAIVTRGWSVFPVLPNSKQPAITDWPDLACNDPAKVRRAWPDGHNVGIACGPSALVVVDLDAAKGKTLPPPWDTEPGVTDGLDVWTALRERHDPSWPAWLSTYTVSTPSGGLHLYFRKPTDSRFRNTASLIGPMVDTRADGGYAIAAGSIVDGKPYQVLDESEPLWLPVWLAKLLTKTPARPAGTAATTPKPPGQPDKYINAAFEREIETVADAWEGGRNNQLNKCAYALARFVAAGQLDRDVAVAALTRAAETCGLEHTEITQTLRSAFTARGAAA